MPFAVILALLAAIAPGPGCAAAGDRDLSAVSGLACVHRQPWVCAAPAGTFSFRIRLSSAGAAAVAGDLPFTEQGTHASLDYGLGRSSLGAGATLPITVHAQGSGTLTLALGAPPALTVYVGAGRLPPWPGTPRTAPPRANVAPPHLGIWVWVTGSERAYLAALGAAHRHEGLAAWRLPRNFARLSAVDQLFVLTNLERVSRGLWPLWAVSASLDAVARVGARDRTDPVYRGAAAWGSNWFSGTNPAQAMFGWMYDDGAGRWDVNLDCPRDGARGCWGHRDNILADWGPYGLFGGAVVAGGGTTELMVQGVTPVGSGLQYTWADAVRMGARPAN